MTELNKKTLGGIVTLTAFVAFLAGGQLPDDGTPYYCEARGLVCTGTGLSDSGKTCYYVDNGTERRSVCYDGWVVLETGVYEPPSIVKIFGNNCVHTCRYSGTLGSYDTCYCDNGQYAYAGELI